MITCRSKVRCGIGAFALIGLLSACAEGDQPPGFGFLSGAAIGTSQARTETRLAGGALALTSPPTWCLEPRSLRTGAQGSFALVAGCLEITREERFETTPRAYATVVVGPFTDAPPSAEALLSEVMGASAAPLRVERNGLALVQIAPNDAPGPVWRGATLRGGWPVLITIYAADNDLAGDRGAQFVRDIASGLREAPSARVVGEVSE